MVLNAAAGDDSRCAGEEITLSGAKGTAREVLETVCSALDKAALRIAVAAAAGEDGKGTFAAATACFMAWVATTRPRDCCFVASLTTLAMAR